MLRLAAVVWAVIPLIVDTGPTHIFHPAWSSHARFHAVWQLSVNTMLGILAVLLIWWPGPSHALRGLARCRGVSLLEASSWQHSPPPLWWRLQRARRRAAGGGHGANLVAFAPTLLIQLAGLALVLLPRHQVKAA